MKNIPNEENEEKETNIFNVMFEAIHDCAFILQKDGTIFDVNKNALNKLGYEEEDLIGTNILEFIPPGTASESYDQIWALTSENNKTSFESVIYNSTIQEITVEINAHFLGKDDVGTALVSLRDISHRKGIETTIDITKGTKDNAIIQSSPDGYLMISRDGRILDTNPAYAQISGYTKSELLTMNYYDIVAGKKGQANKPIPQNSLFNNLHKTKSGNIIPVKVEIRYLKNVDDQDVTLMFIYSIKEHIQLLKQLRKERKIMEKILASITNKDSTGVMVGKNLYGFAFANDFIIDTFGYSKDELMAFDTLPFLMDPVDPDGNIDKYLGVLNGDLDTANITHRFIKKNGRIFQADVEIKNHKDSSGENIMIMLFANIVHTEETADEKLERNLTAIAEKYEKEDLQNQDWFMQTR